MHKITSISIVLSILPPPLWAQREHPEKWYQVKWCEAHQGQVEVVLPDGVRCDCVTDTHAIEFDFGNNWAHFTPFEDHTLILGLLERADGP